MKETIKELSRLSAAKVKTLLQEKKEGKPLIEFNSTFIPEEIIRASGANTYFMCRGGESEPTDAVLNYTLRFMNPLARSMGGFLELGLDPVTPNADLVVTAQTDCHIGRISELLEFKGIRLAKVGLPPDWQKDVAFEYYVRSLQKMLQTVEEITGKPADMELAEKYLEQSNAINACFRRINELRRGDTPIGFEDYMRLQHLSFSLGEPETILARLEDICGALCAAPGRFAKNAPRILLVGRVIAIGDYTVPRLFDECGGAIVAELLDEGIRVTEKDVELGGDLVRAFAKNRYLDKLPIDVFQPSWELRFERIKQLIEDFHIDGVAWYQLAFDEIYDMEYTCVSRWLKELNIPLLKLETNYSYSREELSPLTARIEGFVQSLKNR